MNTRINFAWFFDSPLLVPVILDHVQYTLSRVKIERPEDCQMYDRARQLIFALLEVTPGVGFGKDFEVRLAAYLTRAFSEFDLTFSLADGQIVTPLELPEVEVNPKRDSDLLYSLGRPINWTDDFEWQDLDQRRSATFFQTLCGAYSHLASSNIKNIPDAADYYGHAYVLTGCHLVALTYRRALAPHEEVKQFLIAEIRNVTKHYGIKIGY